MYDFWKDFLNQDAGTYNLPWWVHFIIDTLFLLGLLCYCVSHQ